MKNSKIMFAIIIILAMFISLIIILTFWTKSNGSKNINTVFIGPKEYQETFGQSFGSAKLFYDLQGKARENIKSGNYELAIASLNASLPYVGIGPEKASVYLHLAEIYRDLGNLEKELEYIQIVPKYTMSDREKIKCAKRAQEIQFIFANPKIKNNLSDRYPAPPLYGRLFKNYREVVMAQADSKKHLDNASLLLRNKKYLEAIEEYKKAYYPDSADNAFIESGLIQCYKGLSMQKEALILIDYTLKNHNWAPENVKEFQDLREAYRISIPDTIYQGSIKQRKEEK